MLDGVSSAAIDLALTGGSIADVRAGFVRRAAVGIANRTIARIGSDDEVATPARKVIDVSGQIIVPGYIEPHGHILLANPVEFAGALLRTGTTTAIVDSLPFMLLTPPERLPELLASLSALPMKFRWLIRLQPQSFADTGERFRVDTLRALWRQPWAAAVGEVTRWVDVLDGDPDLVSKIRAAREDGKRVEGHAAGASYERLVGLAAAGFTSCHEAVTAQEVRDRLRAGLVTMLRHSSIRPDLPELITGITRDDIEAGRVMLTADGPTPAFISEHGYLDYLLAVAMRSGLAPMDALRMVTLNPTQYYGFRDVGEVAVGKRADLNVLWDLHHPTPSLVLADGAVVAKDQRLTAPLPTPSWDQLRPSITAPPGAFDLLAAPQEATPGLRLVNDVITEAVPPGETSPHALRVALLGRSGQWITQTKLIGFADKLGGLATTISSGFDVLVLGQNPADMADALRHLVRMGGGLVVVEGGRDVFTLPLELGAFSLRPWAEVADANRRFNALLQARGYRFADPIFTLLFLTFDSLPWIRLTSRGLWDVRHRRVLAPAHPI
ncbi:MAG TPA: adenine deaminase C-terminal domain-containing protein [bacterium]